MFRNTSIRSKLILTLLAPLLALIVVSVVGIRSNQAAGDRAARVNDLAHFASSLAPLIHELQTERTLSASYLSDGRASGRQELVAQRVAVDLAVNAYKAAAARVDSGGDNRLLAEKVAYGLNELRRLPEQRRAVDSQPITAEDLKVEPGIEVQEEEGDEERHGHGAIDAPGKALAQYTDSVNDLLDINQAIAPGAGDERLLEALNASTALSRSKDFAALQQGLLGDVVRTGRFQGGQYGKLASLRAAETVYLAQFENAASAEVRERYEATMHTADVERAEQYQEAAVTGAVPKGVNRDGWFGAMRVKLDRMRDMEQRLSADIAATSLDVKRSADRRALLYSLLLGVALLLALALAVVTARSLIRPLGRLKRAAHQVAETKLPGVVGRLQAGEPVDLEAESAPPIVIGSTDEIGELGSAFNDVHRVAVQVAGKEAALRRSVGDMFLNLARRSQSLIDRQLELITGLRRVAEPGPDLDDGLAELDHLATRMRRNAENLIVLSGADTARRSRGPVHLAELIASAVGEIKEHTRVEVMPLDDVRVPGHVASDVSHLLAELIENAVTFSAPGTKALVGGQVLPGGYVLEIEDQGIGMNDEQLVKVNQDLVDPPSVDFALARMLGFFVVRQLANRHGIRVQLRHSWYGGITALVLLPPALLDLPPELAEIARMEEGATAVATAGQLEQVGLGRDWYNQRVPMVHFPLSRNPARTAAVSGADIRLRRSLPGPTDPEPAEWG
jgi:signal transduction histidine kinase